MTNWFNRAVFHFGSVQGLDKKRIALLIFLVSFGSAILGLGIDVIAQGNIAYDKDIQSSKLKPITIFDERHAYVSNSQIYGISAYYQTNDVFCVNNPLNATLVLLVKNPDQFDKIIAIGTDAVQNNVVNTAMVQASLENGISYPDNITLNRNQFDNSFMGTLHNYSVKSEDQLGFLLIPYTNGSMRGSLFVYRSTIDNISSYC